MCTATIKIIFTINLICALQINSHIVFAAETASTESSSKGYIDSSYCNNLLNTDMVRWTSACSIQKGVTRDRSFDPYRTQYDGEATPAGVHSASGAVNSVGSSSKLTINNAKIKCVDLGFKSGTEDFGKCVLQLSK